MIIILEDSFSAKLMKLVAAQGKTSAEVYKQANIDRKLFSKIRRENNYMPSKKTAIALAIALELSLPDTQDLLNRAGYVLSRSLLSDVIIERYISLGKYNIHEINSTLFSCGQPPLTG